jgi:hypothetical protein
MMLQITAPHFVAGIDPLVRAAPILHWMLTRNWTERQIRAYCYGKGWSIERVPRAKPTQLNR